MIVKKPSILLAACNTLQSTLSFPSSQSSTSSAGRPRGTRPPKRLSERGRGYATIAGDARESNGQSDSRDSEHEWPQAPSGQPCPTPYQIFDLKQNGTYSKARYYKLVKLYHPDIRSGTNNGLSENVRMERYRMIVAAHHILSDPVKRGAYDRFGAGWNGKAEVGQADTWSRSAGQAGPFSQSWSDPSDPVWQNATWEDWERWRARRDGTNEKPSPVYMSNSYFLAMIMVLAAIGSSMNYNRAQDAGTYFVEQRDLVHDRAAKELRRVRQEASTLNSRQDRIEYFIRQREATMGPGDYGAIRDERANRVLRDIETCGSEQIRESQQEG
ncbi:related to J domain-containing 1 [Lecanosticta acicola]|uniref:Related to J domain-containing 1 n=1 Tax=Lecanosticta acicola TaxID=111012 RepID=A0AAI8YXQ6_9PEZI|nr:related to J domain-containing 1 [Lecanosticta acicola]